MMLDLGRHRAAVERRLDRWAEERFLRRMWAKDHTLWSKEPVPELADRLGWLFLPETMKPRLGEMERFAEEAKRVGIKNVLLLGMGGSSLAPELFQMTFGNRKGRPSLAVLDSTHPEAIRRLEKGLDLQSTLFIVSSKSGGTTETSSFFKYFWKRIPDSTTEPGAHFAAITDPGTSLAKLAGELRFRNILLGDPEVGGRYSALSPFGLAPAALIGMDIAKLLGRAERAALECGPSADANGASGLVLGAVLGELALAGRDKLTFIVSRSLAGLSAWLEQLVAESTGKMGRGIVTVSGEPEMPASGYGKDRLFVFIDLKSDRDEHGRLAEKLAKSGHPVVRIHLSDKYDIGYEMYRWEVATAAAGAVLGINPFDQPDVQLAKDMAKKAMAAPGELAAGGGTIDASDEKSLRKGLDGLLKKARKGDYLAVMAFLPPDKRTGEALQGLREALHDRTGLPTTLGWGPRVLHSMGQLHKGGPDSGLFVQIVDDVGDELPVPETDYTFGKLVRAQGIGDFAALEQRGRRAVRVMVGGDAPKDIAAIASLAGRKA
jgi:transaldolase/glucose-6-phosphate isomerase